MEAEASAASKLMFFSNTIGSDETFVAGLSNGRSWMGRLFHAEPEPEKGG